MLMGKNNNILKDALHGSIYSHNVSDDDAMESIELDTFDYKQIKEHIKNSSILLNYNTTHKPIITEIIDVFEENKDEFIIDQYSHIGFYWNGIPIIRIKFNTNVKQKELHISLHRYNKEKIALETEKTTQKILMFGLGSSLIIGGVVAVMAFLRQKHD